MEKRVSHSDTSTNYKTSSSIRKTGFFKNLRNGMRNGKDYQGGQKRAKRKKGNALWGEGGNRGCEGTTKGKYKLPFFL